MNQPISFSALAKTPGNPATGGYPYQLKAEDLDKNFTFATSDYDMNDFKITAGIGLGGHQNRKIELSIKIPAVPTTGTHVLGAVNGALKWLATEAC